MSTATVTISIMPVRHHPASISTANWISIMNMPNQGARQVFLYDHGRPHWSQGGPLFYDRRVPPPPPPPPQMGNFPNAAAQLQGPSPQWLRGPFIGGPHHHQQQPHQFDGFGLVPWGNQGNYNRHNRHHQNRNAGGAQRHNRVAGANGRPNNQRQHGNHNDQEVRYLCFKCGDYLQNSAESGVHLCDAGGGHHEHRAHGGQAHAHNNGCGGILGGGDCSHQHDEDLQARLKVFLEEAKVAVSSDVKLSQEDLHKVCLERAQRILTLYAQLQQEQESLREEQEKLEAKKLELETRDTELAALQSRLEEDRGKLLRECHREREEIARKWQELKDEIARMEEMHTMQKGRVRLDVGGSVFTTSRLTLTKDGDSMLAAMFSGRHHVTQEADGTVFIDRDGTHFRYILNYLRDGGVNQDSLPKDRQVLKELRNEAIYFQLNGLVQTIEKFL